MTGQPRIAAVRPLLLAGSSVVPPHLPQPVLTIGNFDGLHLGHRHLLAQVRARADALGAPVAVYTFDPPPRVVLAPQHHQPRICPWPDKVAMLGEAGVDVVVLERFTRAFAQHPAEWFADEILGRRIRPRAIVVGYDFRFGRARSGTIDLLRQRLPRIPIDQVTALELDGDVVSSSRVRRLVGDGQVAAAAGLLDRPHRVCGVVVQGDQRGRTIGFPTANLELDAELVPPGGVYAVMVRVDAGPLRPAVANLGVRPTFAGGRFLVEVHLLDFRGDLYGRQLEVGFVRRLRAERRFADPGALVAQIRKDAAHARTVLEAEQSP
jgi:riboflavin kinase / FMN adenylyltransferase